jgi:hypothetical protein
MKKEYVLGILFFSGLWGISEAVLGGALYGANVEHASIILNAIGIIVLTFANVYCARIGTATAIASFAMLYKFLNEPFFACHFLAIFLIGLCYDLTVNVVRIKNRAISAVATVYLSYALFALMITYVFRYGYWVQGGFAKILSHVGIDGSLAAVVSAIVVPVSSSIAERLKQKSASPFGLQWRFATGGVPILTVGLWVFGVGVYLFS